MPFVPLPNGVRSSLLYLCDGQTLVNTLHFTLATQPTVVQMSDLNVALTTWWVASMKPQVPPAVSLVGVNTIGLWAQNAPGVFSAVSPASVGTAPGATLPANVTWCATLRTNNRGRNYRGRWYHPGVSTGQQNGTSGISPSVVAAIQAALAQLITPANVANFVFVIVSRFLNNLPRGTAIATNVNAISGDLTLDSQRRRLPLRGA